MAGPSAWGALVAWDEGRPKEMGARRATLTSLQPPSARSALPLGVQAAQATPGRCAQL